MKNNYTFEEKIDRIKAAILEYVPAKYIYLFGSYVYGTPTEESDIDIFAVIPDDKTDMFLYSNIIYNLWNQDIITIDLHLYYEKDFMARKEGSLFVRTICNKGKLLYESH